MLYALFALLIHSFALADTAQDDRAVNAHLQRTQTKMQIMRDRTILDNQKTAPPLERSPTYLDPAAYTSYGVEMPVRNPYEDVIFDHLEQPEPSTK
ncbi:MAG: hypothetical protein ABL958_17205 [Bdellovibrionia bacterium]